MNGEKQAAFMFGSENAMNCLTLKLRVCVQDCLDESVIFFMMLNGGGLHQGKGGYFFVR